MGTAEGDIETNTPKIPRVTQIYTNLSFTPSRILVFTNYITHDLYYGKPDANSPHRVTIDSKFNYSQETGANAGESNNGLGAYIQNIDNEKFEIVITANDNYDETVIKGPLEWTAIE